MQDYSNFEWKFMFKTFTFNLNMRCQIFFDLTFLTARFRLW